MRCSCCGDDYPESLIQLSHNVPLYLFFIDYPMDRNARKNKADKVGRRYLCVKCHNDYEQKLNAHLILTAREFAQYYFKINKRIENDTDS